MKIKSLIQTLFVAAFVAALTTDPAMAKDKKEDQSALQAQAKISKADAEKTALAKVSGGTVKDAELEKEDGVLIWSIEISTPGSKDITEVNVDATTGKIVNVETESANKKEKDEDKD